MPGIYTECLQISLKEKKGVENWVRPFTYAKIDDINGQ